MGIALVATTTTNIGVNAIAIDATTTASWSHRSSGCRGVLRPWRLVLRLDPVLDVLELLGDGPHTLLGLIVVEVDPSVVRFVFLPRTIGQEQLCGGLEVIGLFPD